MANVVAVGGSGHTNVVVTETSHRSKMSNARAAACVGIVMYITALVLVGWNEYNTVQVREAIDAAEMSAEEADCDNLSNDLQGELVFVNCPVTDMETLAVSAPFAAPYEDVWASTTALRVTPTVEYFAWEEISSSRTVTCTGVGEPVSLCSAAGNDITITVYSNQPTWTTAPQTSWENPAPNLQQRYDQRANAQIAQPCGSVTYRGWGNWLAWLPPTPPSGGMVVIAVWIWWDSAPVYSCSISHLPEMQTQYAQNAKLGTAYRLSNAAIDDIANSAGSLALAPAASAGSVWGAAAVDGQYLCLDDGACSSSYSSAGWDWWNPGWGQKIGNRRISFDQVVASQVSALAQQGSDGTLEPWEPNDIPIFKMVDGSHTKEDLIEMLRTEAAVRRWLYRIAGWLLACIGLTAVCMPLSTAYERVPIIGPAIGDLVGTVLCFYSCAIATSTSLLVAAIFWVVARPDLGGPILIFSGGILVGALLVRCTAGGNDDDKKNEGVPPTQP